MSTRDQIAVAQLSGCAQRHVAKRIPVAEVVAELWQVSAHPDFGERERGAQIISGSIRSSG